MYLLAFSLVLIVVELIYFKIARAFNIIDKPNERSLHQIPTIRGGGVIFPLALLGYGLSSGEINYYFLVAALLLAVAGMADDLKGLGRRIRFGTQVVAMILIFYDLHIFELSAWMIVLLLIATTATVNAYNFMDGINGITGGYSLVVLAGLLYINNNAVSFVDNDLLLIMMIALGVFSFFNFRIKAVCFAGDVGSLTIGFAIVYLILKLIAASHNYVFVLLLAVYGVDSFFTIMHRLILKQNIFKAHRIHLYQVIISTTGIHHLTMTAIYMVTQLTVSAVVIYCLSYNRTQQYLIGFSILALLGAAYIVFKNRYYKLLRNAV